MLIIFAGHKQLHFSRNSLQNVITIKNKLSIETSMGHPTLKLHRKVALKKRKNCKSLNKKKERG